jgi:hypothetical protein
MKISRLKIICYPFFSIVLLNIYCSLESSPTPPADAGLENTVFPGAKHFIETGSPEFGSTTDSVPSFTWKATGQKLVFLAIFNDNIDIKDNRIQNLNNIIWGWHSGFGRGREGFVQFSDGRDFSNGKFLEGQAPTPLHSDSSYVWAVWAWDDEGLAIEYSSEEMFFTVE